ncbi:MAG: hypothetical protein JRJ56_04355, partial [Deltaproteobacteria bacterium]|nr:hypothetical protein [Deltaproteobacteria bacterium]
MLDRKDHTIIFFLILSLLFHLAIFFHYRRWTPVVNLDKILRQQQKKEPIPVSIIELPRQPKKPKAKIKPPKSRLLADRNQRVKKETQPDKLPPGSGPDLENQPGKPVVAIPKPQPKPRPAVPPKPAAKKTAPRKTAVKKPAAPKKEVRRRPMGESIIKKKPVKESKKPPAPKKDERAAESPAKKLFPSYDE